MSGGKEKFKSPVLSLVKTDNKHATTHLRYPEIQRIKLTFENPEARIREEIFEFPEQRIMLAVPQP